MCVSPGDQFMGNNNWILLTFYKGPCSKFQIFVICLEFSVAFFQRSSNVFENILFWSVSKRPYLRFLQNVKKVPQKFQKYDGNLEFAEGISTVLYI